MKKRLDEAGALGMLCMAKNQFPEREGVVVFLKRTNGKLRKMKFDFNIEPLVKGTGPSKIFGGKALVLVRETKTNQLKSIPIDSLVLLKVNGRVYRVVR